MLLYTIKTLDGQMYNTAGYWDESVHVWLGTDIEERVNIDLPSLGVSQPKGLQKALLKEQVAKLSNKW